MGGKITLRGSPSLHLIKGSFDIAQQILARLDFCDILEPLFSARLHKCSGTYDVSQRHFFTRCINDKETSELDVCNQFGARNPILKAYLLGRTGPRRITLRVILIFSA